MIGDSRSVSLNVCGKGGSATCRDAESLGLIVTELVINCLKHAFNDDTKDGKIIVLLMLPEQIGSFSMADNGVGRPDGVFAQPKIGTDIVSALAKQLDAQVVTLSGPQGTTVSVTHATFAASQIRAA
jgi:two-component sensor histidine kinase